MAWRSRRSACYRRFDSGYESYSRSYNAQCAEEAGRYPKTRAAAALGVSVKAFDAGCAAADYRSNEFHYVGKYANRVNYYDMGELKGNWRFWTGAARVYRSKSKRAALVSLAKAAFTITAITERIDANSNDHNLGRTDAAPVAGVQNGALVSQSA